MLFHSNEFLIFLGGVLLAYYLVRPSLAARNGLLLAASYIFYSWWDYRFSGLLLFTSLMDFSVALAMGHCSPTGRKILLVCSLAVNLGVLALFKYLDFFGEGLHLLLRAAGWTTSWTPLRILLPVGISFYTFQSMSYVIDVYRGDLPATRHPVQFLAYVAFFPQLVAGPIERATHLLPQFARRLEIVPEKLEQGMWLILWGLFKKVALADNLAPLAEMVFRAASPTGPMVLLGTVAFALQIYCDFSAYSDIARGVANWFGFDLMVNFNLPYFATSLREFWRRWHISLSTWLRDYLYTPLGGNRRGLKRTCVNLVVTMGLAGLWHGAGAQFVLWGLWHGFGLSVQRLWSERPQRRPLPAWLGWALTMAFVLYGWIMFRAHSLTHLGELTAALATWSVPPWWMAFTSNLLILTLPLALVEGWLHRHRTSPMPFAIPDWSKALLQGALLLGVVVFWERDASPFIYFQF